MRVDGRTWLRRLTWLALIAAVSGLGFMAFQRARTASGPGLSSRVPTAVPGENGEPAAIYTEFEHHETVAGVPIFDLASSRVLGFSSGWQEIEGVRLQLYTDGVPGPVLTCERAEFNVTSRDARLRGAVHIQFQDGGFLSTEIGHYDADARQLVTDADTFFSGNGTVGHAGRAAYWLDRDRLVLGDSVVVRAANGATLSAPELEYDRRLGRATFVDGCRVEHFLAVIEAPYATVDLREGEGIPSRVLFDNGVAFTAETPDPDTGRVEGWAERLVVQEDALGRWSFVARTSGPWVTLNIHGGPGFLLREIKTWMMTGVASSERGVLNLRGEQGVCLLEIPESGACRRAEARTARVWFNDRGPTDVALERDVFLRDSDIEATGARAQLSGTTRRVQLDADPGGRQRATIESDRGYITADQVFLFEVEGRAEARGNVQGRLVGAALLGTADGGAAADREPVHFAAGRLDVLDEGTTFHLRDAARAWQGRRLLLADEVVYRQRTEHLSARGHVRTTFPADDVDGTVQEADVVVVARSLEYERGAGSAVYTGGVRYSDAGHVLSTNELSAQLDGDGNIEGIDAIGAVEMVDLATGRRMRGDAAHRDMRTGVVDLRGDPVELTDSKGNIISGTELTWHQLDGRVSISGGPDSQTETIYHPETEPPNPSSPEEDES